MSFIEPQFSAAPVYAGIIDAAAYPTIQAALDAAPAYDPTTQAAGTIVRVPPGRFNRGTTPAMGQLTLRDGVKLLGYGPQSTILEYDYLAAEDQNKDIVTATGTHAAIEGLCIRGCDVAGTGRGVVRGLAASVIRNFLMREVFIEKTPSWSLYVLGDSDFNGSLSIDAEYDHCRFQSAKSNGAVRINFSNTTQYFRCCEVLNPIGYGYYLESAFGVKLSDGIIEITDDTKPYVYQTGCVGTSLRGVHFESHAPTAANWFLWHEGRVLSARYEDCEFVRNVGSSLRLLKANGSGSNVTRKCVLRSPFGWTGSAPAGADDIVTVHAADELHLYDGTSFKTDNTNERALSTTGPGIMLVTP